MRDVKMIKVSKGFEDRFLIEKDLDKPEKFFYYAYKRSADLINEICSATDRSDYGNSILDKYYHNNIIVYCAERGGGKSTAMLSVANSLYDLSKKERDEKNALYNLLGEKAKVCNFSVLSPIDPCSISSDESFMRITISRMFSDLRMKWEKDDNDTRNSGDMQTMYARSKVVEKFTECYKLLDFIYSKKKDTNSDSDLEELTELGDFSRLKNTFRELVDCYLNQIHGNTKDSYLVMLVDDADLNTQKSFEIIEDIRKYCIIPNVILLMAVNMDQMHQIIEQHFIVEFKPLLDYYKSDSYNISDTRSPQDMTVRYLNKILPATHQIHLPVISDFIVNNSSRLQLEYTGKSDKEERDLLTYSPSDYQERLINLIHKKTGVDLVKPGHYLHNFIPGNMRDLTHFLSYFNALPDLNEELGYADMYAALLNAAANNNEDSQIQEAISRRLGNLDALQVYFIYNWCDRNLSKENYQIILKLAGAVDSLKVPSAINIVTDIINRYGITTEEKQEYTYANLMRLISALSKNARNQRDFMQTYKLVFALRMFFTIFLHREMLGGMKNNDFSWVYEITGGVLWNFDYAKIFGAEYQNLGHFEVNIKVLKKLYSIPEKEDGESVQSQNLELMRIMISKYCYVLTNDNYTRIVMPTKHKKEELIERQTICFDISAFLLSLLTTQEYYLTRDRAQLACLNHLYNVLINWDVFHQITKYAESSKITETKHLDPIIGSNALINLLCGTTMISASDNESQLNLPYLELNNKNQMPENSFKVDNNFFYTNYDNIRLIADNAISSMREVTEQIPDAVIKISDNGDNSVTKLFVQENIMSALRGNMEKLLTLKKLTGSKSPIKNIDEKYEAILSAEDDIIQHFSSQTSYELFFELSAAKMSTAVKNWRKAINKKGIVDGIMNAVADTFGIEKPKPKDDDGAREAKSKEITPADNTDPQNDPTGAEKNEDAKEPSKDSVQSDPAGTDAKRSE